VSELLERPPDEHLREVRAVLAAATYVARRLGPFSGVRSGVGGRGPTRERLLDSACPQRRSAHARQPHVHAAVDLCRRDADGRPVLIAAHVLEVHASVDLRNTDLREHLTLPQRGLERTGEELDRCERAVSVRAVRDEVGVEREQDRAEVRSGIAVGDRAADRAAVTHLRVADAFGRVVDHRALLREHRIPGQLAMARKRADCDPRWWNKVREFGALLAQHGFLEDSEDVFQLSRHEVQSALDELVLTWATGGEPLGPKHWPPIAARRKELLERLAEWTPPPALGVAPEAVTDPALIMLWGITTERVREWARSQDGGSELRGAAASPGVAEGLARVVKTVREISDVRKGEILVCSITSPAWAPIFSKVEAVVTDIGGVMSHAAIVCREYGLPAVVGTGRATSQIRTGQMIRVDGTAGVVTIVE